MSSQIITLKVDRIERETSDAAVIVLSAPDKRTIPFIPGQFLTFRLNIEGQKVSRSYSICSTMDDQPEISVAVKHVKDGYVSGYLTQQLKAGDMLESMEPMGNFILRINPEAKRHIILFGAGSGITPLMSILRSVLKHEPGSKVSLIYANENENSVIFSKQLEALQSTYPERFRIRHVFHKPLQTAEYTGLLNTTLAIHLLGTLPDSNADNTEFYMCGPAGFMDVVKQSLQDMSIPTSRVHKESFSAPAPGEGSTAAAQEPLQTRTVNVIFDKKNYTYEVTPDTTVLFAGLDAGIDLPYSCQGGVCTACRGKLKSGKMHLDEREGLSDAELKEGYVLTCVGHPLTDDVVIEIG